MVLSCIGIELVCINKRGIFVFVISMQQAWLAIGCLARGMHFQVAIGDLMRCGHG